MEDMPPMTHIIIMPALAVKRLICEESINPLTVGAACIRVIIFFISTSSTTFKKS